MNSTEPMRSARSDSAQPLARALYLGQCLKPQELGSPQATQLVQRESIWGIVSVLTAGATFWAALIQGMSPLYTILLGILALLFAGLLVLVVIDIAKKRSRVKKFHEQGRANLVGSFGTTAYPVNSALGNVSLHIPPVRPASSIESNNVPHLPRTDEYEPLSIVAWRVMEQTRESGIGKVVRGNKSFGAAARLDWIGTWLVESKKLPLYGKRLSTQHHQRIPLKECKRLLIVVSTNVLQNRTSPREAVYCDLAVKMSDLKDRWADLVADQ